MVEITFPMITIARLILMMCHVDKFVALDSCIGWVFIGSFRIRCHDHFFFVVLCDIVDVLLHCIVDAILGTLSILDIGMLFPDDDPKWCGVAFCVFVKEVVNFY